MEVDRRVGEVRVTQQHLDRAQVGAGLEQVRGVGVAQRILTLPMNRPPRSFTTVTIPSTGNT